jgi:hypothetical protein
MRSIAKIESRTTLFRIVLFYYRRPNSIMTPPDLDSLSIPSLTASRRLAPRVPSYPSGDTFR